MPEYYERPTLDNMALSLGKKVRLHRLLYEYGLKNGRLLVLPIDQGFEHGPADFFANPDSKFPDFQYRLAKEGGYSAIALHYGLAAKYQDKYAGEVPLIVKINGKTNIPSDDLAFSPLTATVEDAVRLGADAVGYTLFVGSPAQADDIAQLTHVRQECDRLGMPLIVWAYPRGEAIERKGGRDSFYAIDYAARVAQEMGAEVVKVNFPKINPSTDRHTPSPYSELELTPDEAFKQIVQSAGKTMVLVSGGGKVSDADLLAKVEATMAAGATGLIFGRNMWQRPMDEALKLTESIRAIMLR
ncbi:MAG: fructose-bisphosphate aldolase [Candidatus Riflebacteria bacterium RBG_13_59_9]|nr:MAG: fructose-bisphosphate aldolase [Candidatus Riflebacteria bacterium RBG_13_59_9]